MGKEITSKISSFLITNSPSPDFQTTQKQISANGGVRDTQAQQTTSLNQSRAFIHCFVFGFQMHLPCDPRSNVCTRFLSVGLTVRRCSPEVLVGPTSSRQDCKAIRRSVSRHPAQSESVKTFKLSS